MRSGPGDVVITGGPGRWFVRDAQWIIHGPYRFRLSAVLMRWCLSDD